MEGSDIFCGDNVTYGARCLVHGGGRLLAGKEEPTFVADDVTLAEQALVFRSIIGQGATIGAKSAVVNSVLTPGAVIPDRLVYFNDAIVGEVEW